MFDYLDDIGKFRAQLHMIQDRSLSLLHRIDFTKNNQEQILTNTDSASLPTTTTHVQVSSNTVVISNKSNELIRLTSSDLNGKDVAIENLKQCELFLHGLPSSIQIKNLHACILIVGPCLRSILIDQCQSCEFALACQQLRIHTSIECDFYVHITAQPIIEDCQQCRFAPYNVEYDLKNEHIAQSGLVWSRDYWNDVRDFNHMIPNMPSPNWQIIEEEERKQWSLDK
jgi:tubulin-specific chaperone C